MKKFIIVCVLLVSVALIPFIGNSYVTSEINNQVAKLKTFGLDVHNEKTQSSYMSTSKHFEFVLQDSEKFIDYLNQYTDKQLPTYTTAALDGMIIAADVSYSNIPFTKDIEVEIYPVSLSAKIKESLQQNDAVFAKHLESFLASKGLLYHINYNLISKDFHGYVKNIMEYFTLKTKAKLLFVLNNLTFQGNGELIAPTKLQSGAKIIKMQIEDTKEKVVFNLENVKSSSNFESPLTYISTLSAAKLVLDVQTVQNPLSLNTGKLQLNISSNDQGSDAEMHTKLSLQNFSLKTQEQALLFHDFASNIAINKLDKKAMDDIRIITNKMQNDKSPLLIGEMQKAVIALLSHGMKINIAQFQADNIVRNDTQKLGDFKLTMDTTIKADKDLAHKMQTSPMLMLQNIDSLWHITLDETFYKALGQNPNIAAQLKKYAKHNGDDVVFDIAFKDAKLSVNGQPLK